MAVSAFHLLWSRDHTYFYHLLPTERERRKKFICHWDLSLNNFDAPICLRRFVVINGHLGRGDGTTDVVIAVSAPHLLGLFAHSSRYRLRLTVYRLKGSINSSVRYSTRDAAVVSPSRARINAVFGGLPQTVLLRNSHSRTLLRGIILRVAS